jgi:hypothetical protein
MDLWSLEVGSAQSPVLRGCCDGWAAMGGSGFVGSGGWAAVGGSSPLGSGFSLGFQRFLFLLGGSDPSRVIFQRERQREFPMKIEIPGRGRERERERERERGV